MITLHLPDNTPLTAIDQLARRIGGHVQAHPEGHLSIKPRFSVLNRDEPAATNPLPIHPPGIRTHRTPGHR